MVYTIDQIREKTVGIAKQYKVGRMRLFGSYARGEATEDSDVDFLIDRGAIKDLVLYYSFVDELEDAFGCHVDVVMESAQDQEFIKEIAEEGVLIYEA